MSATAILIAGPTASGKSALALVLAEKLGGTIVNGDSMQVYRDLRIITARPTPDEEARVPHLLYGMSTRRKTIRSGAGAAMSAQRSPRSPRKAACRSWWAAPGFISRR